MPLALKKTNQIYAANEEKIFSAGDTTHPRTEKISFINDDKQLDDFIESCKKSDKANKNLGAKKFLENILHSSSFNVYFYKIDLAKWNLENKVSPTSLSDLDFIVIREDHTNDVRVGEFLELYCRTPPLKQPRVVFIPNARDSNLADRLCYANSNISVTNLTDTFVPTIDIDRCAPRSLSDFTKLYEGRCFEVASEATTKQITSWTSGASGLSELAVLITRVRARLLSAERHVVEPEVDALLRRVDTMMDGSKDDIEPLLYLRTTVLLQKLYCSEDAKYLTEAISLASALGDEIGLAACLRFTEFLDVHAALADHMYKKAERTFRKFDATELALYCANNRLITTFSGRVAAASEFLSLIDEIQSESPGLHRRHDIYYNFGVQHLFDGRIEEAYSIFDDVNLLNGRPLIVASAMLGKFICSHLMGDKLDHQSAMNYVNYVITAVKPSNRWHITNLLLNLLVIARSDKALSNDILQLSKSYILIEGDMDVLDRLGENKRLASLVGITAPPSGPRIPGAFGDFQDRYGVAVPYYFIWS